MKIIRKNPLFFAFLFPAVVDSVVTLVGQNPAYWSERVVNEASPAYYILLISPWLFIAGSVIWFVFWYWVFKKLKEPFSLFLMFVFITGHSWGSSSWIWKIMRDNQLYSANNQSSVMIAWGIIVVYFAIISLIATYSLRIYLRKK